MLLYRPMSPSSVNDRAPNPFPEEISCPSMPDIAVEIRSPSNTLAELREKAERYLRLGSTLVWIIRPSDSIVEVLATDGSGRQRQPGLGAG